MAIVGFDPQSFAAPCERAIGTVAARIVIAHAEIAAARRLVRRHSGTADREKNQDQDRAGKAHRHRWLLISHDSTDPAPFAPSRDTPIVKPQAHGQLCWIFSRS